MEAFLAFAVGSLAGSVVGSFLATVAIRWGRGEQVRAGRSRCDGCGVRLLPLQLVPVISYIRQGGRCVGCGAAIARLHLWMELAAAALGGVCATLFREAPLTALAACAFSWMLLLLAVIDWREFWLPDALTVPLASMGLAASFGGLTVRPVDALVGTAAGYTSLRMIAWVYRKLRGADGLGGGDAKLFGAIGAWLGWTTLPHVLLLAALLGFALTACHRLSGRAVSPTDRLPLGTLLAVASWPLWLVAQAG